MIKSGPMTTIQDQGRMGVAQLGVPPSGAMDLNALKIANRCVGNDVHEAGLEYTLVGPTIEFLGETVIAITGASVAAVIEPNSRKVPQNQAFHVKSGDVLIIGPTLGGARGYLAVQGGLDVPFVLGSRSTLTRSQLGGYQGRAIRAGDKINILSKPDLGSFACWQGEKRSRNTETLLIRVFPGSQSDLFTNEDIQAFFGQEYSLRPDSDRMGFRLAGEALRLSNGSDIASEPSFPGNIQIASSGLPIILGRDLPVTGGYAKIATIFAADFGDLAYLLPGQKLRFIQATLDEAKAALIHAEQSIETRFHNIEND